MAEKFPAVLKYAVFKQTHPDYQAEYWRRCQALYAGGRQLLCDTDLLKEIFPPHNGEEVHVYTERKKRASYIPYAGEIINAIVAALTANEVTVTQEAPSEAEERTHAAEPAPPPEDDFYREFCEDVSRPGGRRLSLNALLREQVLTALVKRTAWTLVDLPTAPPEGYPSLEAEEKAGGRRVYACVVSPENVRDWEEDESGELLWAIVRTVSKKRETLADDRRQITETWTYYTRDAWAKYEIVYEDGKEPQDGSDVVLVDQGAHSFGKVPLDRLQLPDGLWAMGKIEPMAVEHFNQRNALNWAKLKSMFPVPVAYLAPPSSIDPVTDDDDRATTQKHGPGYMRVMAAEDRMEYFGPPTEAFAFAKEDLDGLRDEMHRVLHHMALSVDNSGAALQRSAESKSIDQAAAAVVLRALGHYCREHALRIIELAQAGRDGKVGDWTAHGMDSYEDTTGTELVEMLVNLEAVNIPSATFQRLFKRSAAKTLLGQNATEDDLQQIDEELSGSINQDAINTANDPVSLAAQEAEIQTESAIQVEKAKAVSRPKKQPPKK